MHSCTATMLGCTGGLATNENGCELCKCEGICRVCVHILHFKMILSTFLHVAIAVCQNLQRKEVYNFLKRKIVN